jgi:hypothetical protein
MNSPATRDRLPSGLLRIEGLAVLLGAIVLYVDVDYSLLAFVALFLVPDISFSGYLFGPRVGAIAYNAVHTYLMPIAVGVIGVATDTDLAVQLALIWLAHIGVDRFLGYGLKYRTAFGDTHLDRV